MDKDSLADLTLLEVRTIFNRNSVSATDTKQEKLMVNCCYLIISPGQQTLQHCIKGISGRSLNGLQQ